MTRCIWPAWLTTEVEWQAIPLPEDAQVLCAQWTGGSVRLSMVADVRAPKVTRRFLVAPFGQDIPDNAVFIDAVVAGVVLVHVFELKEDA